MAEAYESISCDEFHSLAERIEGLSLASVSRTVGSCLLIEIGPLQESQDGFQRGEFTLLIQSDWRVARRHSVEFGSRCSTRRIESRLTTLKGQRIDHVTILEGLPELRVTLRDGRTISTFQTSSGQPDWSLGINRNVDIVDDCLIGVDIAAFVAPRRGGLALAYCFDDSDEIALKALRALGFTWSS